MPGNASAVLIFCQPNFLIWKFEKKYEIKVKIVLKIANFEDFPPNFCQLLIFCQGGGGANPCKIFTSAHWASTGGQVAYFKIKILFFFSISLVLSFSLILHVKSSLTLKKLRLVKHIQQELSLALKKATLVCCSVSALCGTQFSVLWLFFPLDFIYAKI